MYGVLSVRKGRQMISEKIRALRKLKGWTQIQLSRKIGLSLNSIHYYENEKSVPNVYTAKDIADALGVSLDYLFEPLTAREKEVIRRCEDDED